jgi:hypothetical protein
MRIETVHNGIRYTLSNENLAVDNYVYPIANGRCLENGGWILHGFDFRDFTSGFPEEPHKILDLHHSDYKPYEVRTDMGYGPIEIYYKIIKMEKHEELITGRFKSYKWVEIPIEIPIISMENGDGNTGGEY